MDAAKLASCCDAWRSLLQQSGDGDLSMDVGNDPLIDMEGVTLFAWACGALAPAPAGPQPPRNVLALLSAARLARRLRAKAGVEGFMQQEMSALWSAAKRCNAAAQAHGVISCAQLLGCIELLGTADGPDRRGRWDLGLPVELLEWLFNDAHDELLSLPPPRQSALVAALVEATDRVRSREPYLDHAFWPYRAGFRLCIAASAASPASGRPLLADLLRGVCGGGGGDDISRLAVDAICAQTDDDYAVAAAEQLRGLWRPLTSLDGPPCVRFLLVKDGGARTLELMWARPAGASASASGAGAGQLGARTRAGARAAAAAPPFSIPIGCLEGGGDGLGRNLAAALEVGSEPAVLWFLRALTRGGALDASGAAAALQGCVGRLSSGALRAVLRHLRDLEDARGGAPDYAVMDAALDSAVAGCHPVLLHTLQQLLKAGVGDPGSTLGAHASSAARAAVMLAACGRRLHDAPGPEPARLARLAKDVLGLPCMKRYLSAPANERDETWMRLAHWALQSKDWELDHMLRALTPGGR